MKRSNTAKIFLFTSGLTLGTVIGAAIAEKYLPGYAWIILTAGGIYTAATAWRQAGIDATTGQQITVSIDRDLTGYWGTCSVNGETIGATGEDVDAVLKKLGREVQAKTGRQVGQFQIIDHTTP